MARIPCVQSWKGTEDACTKMRLYDEDKTLPRNNARYSRQVFTMCAHCLRLHGKLSSCLGGLSLCSACTTDALGSALMQALPILRSRARDNSRTTRHRRHTMCVVTSSLPHSRQDRVGILLSSKHLSGAYPSPRSVQNQGAGTFYLARQTPTSAQETAGTDTVEPGRKSAKTHTAVPRE